MCSQRISLDPTETVQILTCLHRAAKLAVVGVDPLDFICVYDWVWERDNDEQEVES